MRKTKTPNLRLQWSWLVLVAGCGFGLAEVGDTGDGDKFPADGVGDGLGDDADSDGGDADLTDADADADTDADADADADADTDADADAGIDEGINIDAIEPQHGTNLGGTLVRITGGPFEPGSVVKIAGESVPVAANLGDEIRVETPVFDGEGWASVRVIQPDGASDEITDGFRFWQDGTGLTGATGFYQWVQPVGGYWSGGVPPDPWGSTIVHFVVPIDFHWWNLISNDIDTCEDPEAFSFTDTLAVYDLDETVLALSNEIGATTLLDYDEDRMGFVKSDLVRTDFKLDQEYTMLEFTGDDAPPGEVLNFMATPDSFDVSSPAIDAMSIPYINRNQTVSWDAGGADVVWIEFSLLNATADAVAQSVVCIATDDGSFTIPASAWSAWPSDRQVNVAVSKVVESGATFAHNNSSSRVAAFYTVFGAGFSQ